MKMNTLFLIVSLFMAALAIPTTGILSDLLGLIQIKGTVFCTANGNADVNTNVATPVFASTCHYSFSLNNSIS